jgi:hypothetical protein
MYKQIHIRPLPNFGVFKKHRHDQQQKRNIFCSDL